jgi:hypothetical protein
VGLLDKQSRVIDFVLTERGRRLYAAGELDFTYYAFFDDGIDYDPYSSGSLSHEQRELDIESTPMFEAPFVREVRGAEAGCEPRSHLFTAAPGYGSIPHISSPTDDQQFDLSCEQFQRGGTFERSNSNAVQIDLRHTGEVESINQGFIIRVFSSGSEGLSELDPRRDLSGRRSYDPFLAIAVDADPIDPVPAISRLRPKR